MRNFSYLTAFVFIFHSFTVYAHTWIPADSIKKKTYTTARIKGQPLVIDGVLDDPAWEQVAWGNDFIQWSPNEREDPAQQTVFKILYDEKNLYVGIRAYDTEPGKIVRRMGRRDNFDGDWVEINIDSYNDKRTAFSFTASVSGVKGDKFISGNGNNWDESWDPIWYLKTSIDEQGWIAEFRIPLSQLRFSSEYNQTWGLQIQRRFFREEERSLWQFIPRNDVGWVHRFGELRGIEGIKPQKQVEIMPYVVGKAERYEGEEGNPFATGRDQGITFGIDGKIGITNDVTLDFTVNPDFGQVEADPSQLNLSAFQLFFEERRPFFIEGNNILNFQVTQFRNDNLFYSRRIGDRPSRYPDMGSDAYEKIPDNTRILGAAKITGKNKNGLSFGIQESVTAREYAEIDINGERSREPVEPLTNYIVARASQDLNKGNTVFGGMVTSLYRDIRDPSLEFLHKKAWSGGLDLLHQWNDKKWFFSVNSVFSNVQGTTEAIYNTQTSSERYFQRPDNFHKSVDTTRTSLTGTGGQVKIGKQSGKIIYELGTTWLSPNLDLNDQGFLMNTDNAVQWLFVQYRINKPFSIFRNMRAFGIQYATWDFGGVSTGNGFNFQYSTQFKNYWGFNLGTNFNGAQISNADLRGGPSILYPRNANIWYWIGSDSRKKFQVMFNNSYSRGDEKYNSSSRFWMRFRYRPLDVLNISISPSLSYRTNQLQYVTTTSFGNDPRYITANIDQKTYRMEIRFSYSINPNLSLQFWGQPFVTTGEYTAYKRITDSKANRYTDRFHTFTADEIAFDETENQYYVDENQDGVTDYQIYNPNFNFLQFRSNAVLRWEYKPGSTLFLVWTQERTDNPQFAANDNSLGGITQNLFAITPSNMFLIKYTYRFIF
ncbi:MAG: carbohydrate binding family 9 domain-containing protein [Bacteroidetes bacterium]|nr:carbohydrate binding family 9 domain-containing protein [Bacteroidota bacterium]